MPKRKAAAKKSVKGKGANAKGRSTESPANARPARRIARSKSFKVFIAWSGRDGRSLGSSLNRRLKTIIPKIKVLFSPAFNPGAAWARSVQASIRSANYAIICVTKSSLDSRWINFEAGAAWKSLKQSNVCPLLLDIEPNDLKGPLELFQARQFNRGDFEDLCRFLGRKTKTSAALVQDNFDAVWPGLEKEIRSGMEDPKVRKVIVPDLPGGGG
jgi:hypothetical protein